MNERHEYQSAYYHKHKKKSTKRCAVCGGELEHGNQTYCLDCLLKDYMASVKGELGSSGRNTAYHRLVCRGYDITGILKACKERGIT